MVEPAASGEQAGVASPDHATPAEARCEPGAGLASLDEACTAADRDPSPEEVQAVGEPDHLEPSLAIVAAAEEVYCSHPRSEAGVLAIARVAEIRLHESSSGAAELTADGLDIPAETSLDAFDWLLHNALELIRGGLGAPCRERIEGRVAELAAACAPAPTAYGFAVTGPPTPARACACRMVRCWQCRVGVLDAEAQSDVGDHAAASRAYEALAFGPGARCPGRRDVGEAAVSEARRAGEPERAEELGRRVEERFPLEYIYLVNRAISSPAYHIEPCR